MSIWIPQYVYLQRDLAEFLPGSYDRYQVVALDLTDSRMLLEGILTGCQLWWHRIPSRSSGAVSMEGSIVRWESGPPMEVF